MWILLLLKATAMPFADVGTTRLAVRRPRERDFGRLLLGSDALCCSTIGRHPVKTISAAQQPRGRNPHRPSRDRRAFAQNRASTGTAFVVPNATVVRDVTLAEESSVSSARRAHSLFAGTLR